MNKKNIIMNFSHIYEKENFYIHQNLIWIDCTHIQGTNCYCDKDAEIWVKRQIALYPPEGIHFIDSGNYHYISKFWIDKLQYPFNLLVFDYHSDMQKPLFEDLLSCGCWIRTVLDTNPQLHQVFLVGLDETFISQIQKCYQKRLVCISCQQLQQYTAQSAFPLNLSNLPVYISIDKDVLSTQFARTNWSQGILSMAALKSLLTPILRQYSVIGVDICGEYNYQTNYLPMERSIQINNQANQDLLKFLLHA